MYPLSAELIKDLTDGGYELSSPERIPDTPPSAAIWTNAEPSIKFVPAHPLIQSELSVPTLSCNGYVTVAEPEIQYAPLHPLPTTVPDSLVQQSDSLATAAQNSVLNQPPNVDSNLDGSLGLGPQLGSDVSADGLHEFEAMIDDMVYKVWECGRCLSMGHKAFECANDIRCKACFSYGHMAKKCLSKNRKKSQIWVPKTASVVTGLLDSRNNPLLASSAVPPLQSPQKSQFCAPSSSTSTPSGAIPPAMAVYEIDPTPWLPLGHEIIDGGPNRLPRTFYTPPEMPQRRHDNLCVAYIAPPQPEGDAFWREQVRLFVEDNLGLDVMDAQPSLFGVGLFEMRSPATRQILVQQPQRQIANGVFVRFANHDQVENHRGT
jgi:hypothetical protein